MPKLSSVTNLIDHGPICEHFGDSGGYTVNFVEFREDIDATPLMKGLPGDRCQCPHWGYVIKGRMTMRYPDREEVYTTGDTFFAPSGHVPVKHEPGTQLVLFSPTRELRDTEAVMNKNLEAMMKK